MRCGLSIQCVCQEISMQDFQKDSRMGIHVQSPSYSALIQSSIILLILVSTGLAELFAIRKSFDLRIAVTHAEVTRAASALRANGLPFLAMETQYWAMHHDHPPRSPTEHQG